MTFKLIVTFKVIVTFSHPQCQSRSLYPLVTFKDTVVFNQDLGHVFQYIALFLKVIVTLCQGHGHIFYYFHKAHASHYYHS